jgi:uncharacterized protein
MKKIFVMALILTVLMATTVAARTINIASSNPGSATHSASAAVAKVIADSLKTQTRVIPHGGQSAFIPAVNAGEADFGIANSYEFLVAVTGTGIYQGQTLKDLRMVSVLYPIRNAFWVRKDSPIKSIKDLKGKKVPGGWTAQKIVGYTTAALLANAGLTYDDVDMVPVPNVNMGADEFMQGKVETFYFAMGSGKVLEAGSKVGGLRALSIDTSPEAIARSKKHLPPMYPSLVQPSESNYGIVGPSHLLAIDFILITNKNVPDDLIHQVCKVLSGGKNALTASFKPLGDGFGPDKMAKPLTTGEYHPGAVKFYKEVGLWPPKE